MLAYSMLQQSSGNLVVNTDAVTSSDALTDLQRHVDSLLAAANSTGLQALLEPGRLDAVTL
jgi:hypothetical protein